MAAQEYALLLNGLVILLGAFLIKWFRVNAETLGFMSVIHIILCTAYFTHKYIGSF